MVDPASLSQVRWDTPYRLLASLSGLAAIFAATPTAAVDHLASWAGLHIGKNAVTVDHWINASDRQDILAGISLILFLLSALCIWGYARDSSPSGNPDTRAGSTLVLSYAMLVQTHYWPAVFLLILLASVAALGFIVNLLSRNEERHGDPLYSVIWEAILALLWAPVMLWGWTMLRQAKQAGHVDKVMSGENSHLAMLPQQTSNEEESPPMPYEALVDPTRPLGGKAAT